MDMKCITKVRHVNYDHYFLYFSHIFITAIDCMSLVRLCLFTIPYTM